MADKYIGEFKLNGKTYLCEVVDGKPHVNGKTVDEFVETLDMTTLVEFMRVGKQAIADRVNGAKPKSYQSMMDTFHHIKNN